MKKKLSNKNRMVISTVLMVLVFGLFAGCAGTGKLPPFQMEKMLVGAGFQLHTADTPEKLEFLKSLPQNRLVYKICNEKRYYFYVDGSSCQCMYVGDEQDYMRFKQAVSEEQMDEKIATTMNQSQEEMGDIDIDPNNPFNVEGHLP